MWKKITSFAVLSTFSLSVMAQEVARDPFTPFVWEKPKNVISGSKKANYDSTPLTEHELSKYKVIATVVSPSDAVALIKSRDSREFFVNTGDAIGNEGGIISVISSEGLTVDIDGKPINLTVSNRFDIQDESE